MKYVIFLSFLYKHYKKTNSFRVFLDDQLIDDVQLDADVLPIGMDVVKNIIDSDIYLQNYFKKNGLEKMSNKWWLYTVDIPTQHLPTLRFEFKIGDSNFTNGFMTKSALIKILKIGIVPLNFFQSSKLKSLIQWWKDKNIDQFLDYHQTVGDIWWPLIPNFRAKYESGHTKISTDEWFGVNFSIELPTIIKHKNLYFDTIRIGELRGWAKIDVHFILFCKIMEQINSVNENQRNFYT
jgi:hypothetical protein